MFVMEGFIAANRALLDGVERAIEGAKSVPPHYCLGDGCRVHAEAIFTPLQTALDDNERLGEFISEVVGQAQRM
jgi:hypothetical protein